MKSNFTRMIGPYVEAELGFSREAREAGESLREFTHLERAHVLGQESTYWHVRVHGMMLAWAIRNRSFSEVLGQLFRIVGAATKTAIGLVPQGNTGGANISPFKKMPIEHELAALIRDAKSGV